MKCCQRQAERKVKKYKKKDNIVYPEKIKPEKNLINETLEFNADEKINCGGCNGLFSNACKQRTRVRANRSQPARSHENL